MKWALFFTVGILPFAYLLGLVSATTGNSIHRDLKSDKKRDAELIDPNMKSGEKFKLVNEIREKSKALREAEEKVDTLKRRESQIRETCEAWKKEVFMTSWGFSLIITS